MFDNIVFEYMMYGGNTGRVKRKFKFLSLVILLVKSITEQKIPSIAQGPH
jgi:hypothetical protein